VENKPTHNDPQHSRDGNDRIVFALLVCLLVAGAIYFALKWLHIRKSQLIEASIYLTLFLGSLWSVYVHRASYKKKALKRKPRLRYRVSPVTHERNMEAAFKKNSVVAGYDADSRKPVLWSDEVRTMQGILNGKSGFGKSTLMRNLVIQDALRTVEIDGELRHLPIIVFDGKGEEPFADLLIEDLAAMGRLDDVRLLDPSRPWLSVRYNALHKGSGETSQEHVNFIFESLGLVKDFFAGHQANYFSDLVRVLEHTGKLYNTYDVLVLAFDPVVLDEQIDLALWCSENSPGVTVHERLNLQMSVRNLRESLSDPERVSKIQGLINPLMQFLQGDLSILTGPYDQLLTLSDVFDQGLILIVSLNSSVNERAVPALGRILLKNLQMMVGKRYTREGRLKGMPMASIILDEFYTYAYPTFPRILETARGSNVSILFSVQSIAQLDAIGPGFRDHITAAPSTIMLMQSWDRPSTEYFRHAAPDREAEQLTVMLEDRGWLDTRYEASGRAQSRTVEEPQVSRTQIGSLPRAQMHMLMASTDGEPRYHHVLVPSPPMARVRTFKPTVYPPIPSSNWFSPNGANLRFAEMRRPSRSSGRRR
jgi:hypothetical protein